MKISLSTQSPARLEADLAVAVLDPGTNLFEADDSRLGQALRRAQEGFRQEKYRRELFQTFDENENVKALLVFSTSLSKSFDLSENVKIAAAKAAFLRLGLRPLPRRVSAQPRLRGGLCRERRRGRFARRVSVRPLQEGPRQEEAEALLRRGLPARRPQRSRASGLPIDRREQFRESHPGPRERAGRSNVPEGSR